MHFLRVWDRWGGFIIRVRDAREEGRFQVFFFLIFIFFTWHPTYLFIFSVASQATSFILWIYLSCLAWQEPSPY